MVAMIRVVEDFLNSVDGNYDTCSGVKKKLFYSVGGNYDTCSSGRNVVYDQRLSKIV